MVEYGDVQFKKITRNFISFYEYDFLKYYVNKFEKLDKRSTIIFCSFI